MRQQVQQTSGLLFRYLFFFAAFMLLQTFGCSKQEPSTSAAPTKPALRSTNHSATRAAK